jgi:hypothetical protein
MIEELSSAVWAVAAHNALVVIASYVAGSFIGACIVLYRTSRGRRDSDIR